MLVTCVRTGRTFVLVCVFQFEDFIVGVRHSTYEVVIAPRCTVQIHYNVCNGVGVAFVVLRTESTFVLGRAFIGNGYLLAIL